MTSLKLHERRKTNTMRRCPVAAVAAPCALAFPVHARWRLQEAAFLAFGLRPWPRTLFSRRRL